MSATTLIYSKKFFSQEKEIFCVEKMTKFVPKNHSLITHFDWLENIVNHDMIKCNPFFRP